jgi:anti-sigma factor RsiW
MMTLSEHIGVIVSRPRRRIRVSRPMPAPSRDEPSDDELLRYLDGAMDAAERIAFEARLERSPYAAARIEVLAAALEENGWPVEKPRRGDD